MSHRKIAPRALALAALALLALSVASCSLLPKPTAAPQLFVLTPKSSFELNLPTVESQLVIEMPLASEGLNTHRIALQQLPLTIDYYADARWTERAPKLVQTLLVESFENTGKIVSVARKGTDLRADHTLKTELREFQAEYDPDDGLPIVRVRLNAKVIALPERTIIASTTIEKRVKGQGTNIAEVVAAFDEALGKVLKRAVEWTLETIADGAPPS